MRKIDMNLLVDFILESIDSSFVLFKFIQLHQLKEDKVEKMFKFIDDQGEEKHEMVLEYLPFDHLLIQKMKANYEMLVKKLNVTKKEFKKAKEESNQRGNETINLNCKIAELQNENYKLNS